MKNNLKYGSEEHKNRSEFWFAEMRDKICDAFENIEQTIVGPNKSTKLVPGKFVKEKWSRLDEKGVGGGGGTMSILRGRVFEKAGVNISTVNGEFSEEFRKNIPGASKDPRFWASGISVVAHPLSPLVPTVHMNTRMIVTTKGWFGGGSDLTPAIANKAETSLFHNAFKAVCDRHNPNYYAKFKKWCDEYFFIPHRNEPRGVGGIFYDNLNSGDWEKDFKFTQDIGQAFLTIYPILVSRCMDLPWNEEQTEVQLLKRGRYVEFNLLYDRGTLFGLKTGGHAEAILMSLPPSVSWP